jgi:hypothetical protein
MKSPFRKEKYCSPLGIIEIFDDAYQERTGDKSLFDRTQAEYLTFDKQNRLVR